MDTKRPVGRPKGCTGKIGSKHYIAAAALARGATGAEAAREARVTGATITTWQKRDDFRALVQGYVDEYIDGLQGKAQDVYKRSLNDYDTLPWLAKAAADEIFRLTKQKADTSATVTVLFGSLPAPGLPESAE